MLTLIESPRGSKTETASVASSGRQSDAARIRQTSGSAAALPPRHGSPLQQLMQSTRLNRTSQNDGDTDDHLMSSQTSNRLRSSISQYQPKNQFHKLRHSTEVRMAMTDDDCVRKLVDDDVSLCFSVFELAPNIIFIKSKTNQSATSTNKQKHFKTRKNA
jgi:hypothetical protein